MLKFHCLIPRVAEIMPIIPTKEHKFKWLDGAKDFYKTVDHNKKTISCPGIFSMLNTGWIHRTYMDIHVKTTGDLITVNTYTAEDQLRNNGEVGKYIGEYMGFHGHWQLQWVEPKPSTMKTMLKIQTPWFVEIPKGYSLLMMPVPYNDDNRFTAATGTLRGNNFLNVQLFWHVTEGTEIIKAGTPINQMILVKDDPEDYQIETVSDVDTFLKENYPRYDIAYSMFNK